MLLPPSEHQKFTRFTPFAVMGLVALLGGVFLTVLNTQQNQDVRSRASETATYPDPAQTYQETYQQTSNGLCISVLFIKVGSCSTISTYQPTPMPAPTTSPYAGVTYSPIQLVQKSTPLTYVDPGYYKDALTKMGIVFQSYYEKQVTMPSPVQGGNLLVVAVSNVYGSVNVSDNVGNNYRLAAIVPSVPRYVPQSLTTQGQVAIFYAENAKTGSTTITVQGGKDPTYGLSNYTFAVYEYSGIAKSNALDKTATANGVGSNVTTGTTPVTSQPNELIFAAASFNNFTSPLVTATGDPAYNVRDLVTDIKKDYYAPLMVQDRFVDYTGAYSAKFRLYNFTCDSLYSSNGGCRHKGAIVTFRAEAYYPTPTPTTYYPPTPTPTTYYPPTPTPTPTVYYPPTPTPTKYVTPTATPPSYLPTATPSTYNPTPTPYVTIAPTVPVTPYLTYTPAPTPTIDPYSTRLSMTLALHGIGKGGDNVNPNGIGNTTPLRPQRTIMVDVYDASNTLVKSQEGSVQFDTESGLFKGVISLGTTIVSGPYQIKVKSEQFLRSVVPGIQTLTAGESFTLPQTALVTGDITNDNQINILDYNMLMGCYSDLSAPVSCAPGDEKKADITDDSKVNQFDYNLFLRELTNRGGQ